MQPDNADPGSPSRTFLTRTKIKIMFLLLVAALIAIMIYQNWGQVDTTILFTKISMPRVVFVSIWLFLGFVIGLIAGVCRRIPSSARERAIFSAGKDGEAGDVGFIVDTAGCSQAGKGPLEARSSSPTGS